HTNTAETTAQILSKDGPGSPNTEQAPDEKISRQRTRTRSSSSAASKPQQPRTRTRKKTVSKSAPKTHEDDQASAVVDTVVQLPDAATLAPCNLDPVEPICAVKPEPSLEHWPEPGPNTEADTTTRVDTAVDALAETAMPDVSELRSVSIEDRLAAVAQSPMSSGKVTRRKASRVRRSAHNSVSNPAGMVSTPTIVADGDASDIEKPQRAADQATGNREGDISRRLSQVTIKEPIEAAAAAAAATAAAAEPPEEQCHIANDADVADYGYSLPAKYTGQHPASSAETSTTQSRKIGSPEIFEEQTHAASNVAALAEPVELNEAPSLPNDDDDDFMDDHEEGRQHLAARAMRFKAPRNARAQTYDIDDVPESNFSDIPSTPPRRGSTVRRELVDIANPEFAQQETQEYTSPLPPAQPCTPANANQNSLRTPTHSSRTGRVSNGKPRASLAATQIIPKRNVVGIPPIIPHSPSRMATPHRVVYSPTRPMTQLKAQSPKRKTIGGISMPLPPALAIKQSEDRHRASLPAIRRSLSKDRIVPASSRSSGESTNEPEIEETKVPFLPARRYVQKSHILAACGQTAPIDWVSGGLQACGVLLPNLDSATHGDEKINEIESEAGLCKIGEATYSEVFSAQWRYVPRTRYDKFNSKKGAVKGERLMQVALKIIPFGNSSVKSGTGESQTTLRDLYQEIGATLALSRLSERERGKLQEARLQVKMPLKPKERELGANFVKAFRVCICQGPLPAPLLRAWDRWKAEYPDLCENVRPDYYPANQLFAVFVLEMGGETLENAAVSTWKEARSIIRQLALSMALAERNNRFEHRDLHWGNIMVTRYHSNLTFLYQLPPTGSRLKSTLISIPSYKVRCTIIDYTLSRLHIDNDTKDVVVSKPASYDSANNVFYVALKDEALFQGEGDIQFDVYRQMRACAKDDWEGFHPHTNVLWLTYVLQKILTTKSPAIRDELLAFAESKLGPAFDKVSADVKLAASQEVLRRWMLEFGQCESSSQVLQCALLDLYKS
ncbi:hypothetical protein IWW50_003439, partial [Coemansia erecta]